MAGDKAGIIAILGITMMIIGGFLPFITAEFTSSSTTPNYDTLSGEIDDLDESASFTSILGSMSKMFVWYYADLPSWLNIIFLIMKIIFWVMLIIEITPFLG